MEKTGVRAFFFLRLTQFYKKTPLLWAFDTQIPLWDTSRMRYVNVDVSQIVVKNNNTQKFLIIETVPNNKFGQN